MRLRLRDRELELDPSGALLWPARELLVVADLHLEKGSAFARRGRLLPPYDTHATLSRLEALLRRRRPRTVVSPGDGFHDRHGPSQLAPDLFDRLAGLVRAFRWIWITGNHDPSVPLALGGAALPALELDGLVLRHAPDGAGPGEVAGHLHPKARVASPRVPGARPCFVGDGTRLILPAFASYAGGCNVLDPAIASLFAGRFDAFVLGRSRLFRVPRSGLWPEPDAARHRPAIAR